MMTSLKLPKALEAAKYEAVEKMLDQHHLDHPERMEWRATYLEGADWMAAQLLPIVEEANDMILDMFSQACAEWKGDEVTYDHMCLSAYEGAQDFLIKEGLIKAEQCRRM